MKSSYDSLLSSIGFLRGSLLVLALINILIMLLAALFPATPLIDGHSFWEILSTLIAPVMAPLLATVILFDYVMSRVRASDAEGELRSRFITISRIELSVIALSLLFWVPFFIWDFS